MIAFPAGVKVWIAGGVTDMRCGMNSLALKVYGYSFQCVARQADASKREAAIINNGVSDLAIQPGFKQSNIELISAVVDARTQSLRGHQARMVKNTKMGGNGRLG